MELYLQRGVNPEIDPASILRSRAREFVRARLPSVDIWSWTSAGSFGGFPQRDLSFAAHFIRCSVDLSHTFSELHSATSLFSRVLSSLLFSPHFIFIFFIVIYPREDMTEISQLPLCAAARARFCFLVASSKSPQHLVLYERHQKIYKIKEKRSEAIRRSIRSPEHISYGPSGSHPSHLVFTDR